MSDVIFQPLRFKNLTVKNRICTGGFQTASIIRAAIDRGDCDAVSMARPLVETNDLVKQFAAGHDRADKPCTYCNKCLVHVVEHPLGCYEESRFASVTYDAVSNAFGNGHDWKFSHFRTTQG